MLLIAAHVLGDIERWWIEVGRHLPDGPELGDVYRLLRQATGEAEAMWSALPEVGGRRIYTTLSAAVPLSLEVIEMESSLVVWDIRFHGEPS